MACDGYEHGQRVVLVRRLEEYEIPIGTGGIITAVHRELHKIDVLFVKFGQLTNLDPHSFTLEFEGTPPTHKEGMTA